MGNKSIAQGLFAVMNVAGPDAAANRFGMPGMTWLPPAHRRRQEI